MSASGASYSDGGVAEAATREVAAREAAAREAAARGEAAREREAAESCRVRLAQVEAEVVEARGEVTAMQAQLAGVVAEREAAVESAQQSALEEAKSFLLAEAAAYDQKLALAHEALEASERGHGEAMLAVQVEVESAVAAAVEREARMRVELGLLHSELADRESAVAALEEERGGIEVEARISRHAQAEAMGAVSAEAQALTKRVEELEASAQIEYNRRVVSESLLTHEVQQLEAAVQLSQLRRLRHPSALDDGKLGNHHYAETDTLSALSASSYPLDQHAASREHIAALRKVLASKVEAEAAVTSSLVAEVSSLESQLALALQRVAAMAGAGEVLAENELPISALKEVERRLLTGDGRPVEFKQKQHRRKQLPPPPGARTASPPPQQQQQQQRPPLSASGSTLLLGGDTLPATQAGETELGGDTLLLTPYEGAGREARGGGQAGVAVSSGEGARQLARGVTGLEELLVEATLLLDGTQEGGSAQAAIQSSLERRIAEEANAELATLRGRVASLESSLLAARAESVGLRAERDVSMRQRVEAEEAKRQAAVLRAEANERAEGQAALLQRVEAQLLEQMSKSVAAQQALVAAEEIQRRLDEYALSAGGQGLTLVLMPE